MANKMLIDAAHLTEARVAILHDDELYDYDFVTASKMQIKGNIYLAKITRVEPSLQAAFVEYGGGKQGFLPFSEIHPDYYHMPVSDKQKLLEEQIAEAENEENEEEEAFEREQSVRESRRKDGARGRRRRGAKPSGDENAENDAAADEANADDIDEADDNLSDDIANDGELDSDNGTKSEADAKNTASDKAEYASESQQDIAIKSAPVDAVDTIEADTKNTANDSKTEAENSLPILLDPALAVEPFDIGNSLLAVSEPEGEDSAQAVPNLEDYAENDAEDDNLSNAENAEAQTADADANEEADSDENNEGKPRARGGRRNTRPQAFYRRYKIQEVIKRNQIVLIQVTKEERGNKGCSLTTYISLAGRYCVLMPNSPKGGGISRKITDRETRKHLKAIASKLRASRSMSVIIRTAGIDREHSEIDRDYEYLVKLWNKIREGTLSSSAPALIYEESNLIKRSIRDLYTNDIETIEIEGDEAHTEAKEFMQLLLPTHEDKVVRHTGPEHIFTKYGVDDELEEMLQPHVRLPSGGYLVINPTEALISIDVNSGKSTTERNVEETAIKTNLEAAREVGRQMRLRDLAGLLVIDFIDMNFGKHRRQVERTMRDAVKHDRAKIQTSRISSFGLMELSRQRMRPSLSETMGIPCPYCKGAGVIHSPDTVAFQIIRTLEKEAGTKNYKALRVSAPNDIALKLLNEKREILHDIESRYDVTISISVDNSIITAGFRLIKLTIAGKEVAHEHVNAPKKRRRGGRDDSRKNNNRRSRDDNKTTSNASSDENKKMGKDNADNADSVNAGDDEQKPRRKRRSRGGKRVRERNRTRAENKDNADNNDSNNADSGSNADSSSDNSGNNGDSSASAAKKTRPRRSRSKSQPATPYSSDASEPTSYQAGEIIPLAQAANAGNTAPKAPVAAASTSATPSDTKSDAKGPKRKGWWSRVLEK
jgi:ribonuclease E